MQPFANTLVNMELTGAQIKTALEQQWQPAGPPGRSCGSASPKGFTYTYDPAAAAGSRITQMWLNGAAIDPAATYSVTVNSFLASGGDNFGASPPAPTSGTPDRSTSRRWSTTWPTTPPLPSTTPNDRWASASRPVHLRST